MLWGAVGVLVLAQMLAPAHLALTQAAPTRVPAFAPAARLGARLMPLPCARDHLCSLRCGSARSRHREGPGPAALRCREGETAGTGGESSLTVDDALEQWQSARQFHPQSLKFAVGTSRRYVSLLVVSNNCIRALLVEKYMQLLLPAFFAAEDELAESADLENRVSSVAGYGEKKSDRLLLLSAGLHNEPGAPVPVPLLAAAAACGVDLTDDNPRAAFDGEDLEYFDLILCVDRAVRDKILEMAARRAGGSDRVADSDVFSASSFVETSSPPSSSSSLTRRLAYEEYEKKIILAGGDVEAWAQGCTSLTSEAIEIPKLPDVKLMSASVLSQRLPPAMDKVKKASYWTLHLLARLGL